MKEELISIDKLQEIIINQAKEINYLKGKVDYLLRQQFSSKSEKFNPDQPSLFEDNEVPIEVEVDEEIKIEFTRKKGGRSKPPKDLPRVRVE